MKVAILTSQNQWFVPYAQKLETTIQGSKLFFNHKEIEENYSLVLILSYHCLIEKEYLQKHKHNIVIHASALPKGKGWAPMFWQILEGKNEIPFSMFEASQGIDDGDIYMQRILTLTGFELHDELRKKEAQFVSQMCLEFIQNYTIYKKAYPQIGSPSYYHKRIASDNKLDIHKSIYEQFNLLRICDNELYPAYFELNQIKYTLKIEKVEP
ncbi:MAG: formyltransferase family protein [Sulfurospirillaceae bacterium]|nr:formyltransferase family protein [Sulfurospirillaceae bacterium]MDD2826865.1 formyltransferase family protein [Sulfurospirillaceae bacterium]